jgi:hypothetical protein
MRGKKWLRLGCLVGLAALPLAAHGQVVISQVYGGGGNAGSTWTNDFIELFNRGNTPVDLTGWAVQVTSGTGAFSGNMTPLTSFILQPGQYYLIKEAVGAGGTTPLPTPDATGTIAISATRAKVALLSNTTSLSGTCPTGGAIVDFVGFGNTTTGDPNLVNCFEGSGPAPQLTNTTADLRLNGGCTDTNNNSADFVTLPPNPRNSVSPFHVCTPTTPPTGVGNASPNSECPGSVNPITLTVAVTPGANPTSTGLVVNGDLTAIGGGSPVQFFDDGPAGGHGDAVAGDGTFTTVTTISNSATPGLKDVPVTITDDQGRTGNVGIAVTVNNCTLRGFGNANPPGVCDGTSTLLFVDVTPASEPSSTGIQVVADLHEINGSATQQFYDDGTHGDLVAGDGRFSFSYFFSGVPDGNHNIFFVVSDAEGRDNSAANAHFPVANAACTDSGATVVIEQVYGGGGNTGGIFRNDYIQLFNRSTSPVDVTGWSLQRAAGDGIFSAPVASKTDLVADANNPTPNLVIQPGHYLLVQESQGADGTEPALPPADFVGGMTVSSTGPATIALVNNTTVLASCTDVSIMDKVAYGTASTCFEGAAPAQGTTNLVGVHRVNHGCQDSNNNNIDLFVATPTPRVNSSQVFQCHCGSADFNCDGDTGTDLDIEAFFACLSGTCPPAPCQSTADFNMDGDTGTDLDIEAFFRVLAGGEC